MAWSTSKSGILFLGNVFEKRDIPANRFVSFLEFPAMIWSYFSIIFAAALEGRDGYLIKKYPPRFALSGQKPRIFCHRDPDARSRHRSEHRDFFCRQHRPFAAALLSRFRSAGRA